MIGGTHPAALAADWLVSAWDQNSGSSTLTPATVAMERVAGQWMLDLFGLPATASVGFVTGGQLANFTCLATARHAVLARAGWDIASRDSTVLPRCGSSSARTGTGPSTAPHASWGSGGRN